jgi:hypothetical protein
MSDQDNQAPQPPVPPTPPAGGEPPITSRVRTKTEQVPTKTSRISLSGKPETKTSQIPLRKETVRITLKATPDAPGAPKPMAPGAPPPTAPSLPVAPRPPVAPVAPAATTPLRPTPPGAPPAPPRPVAAGAPTIPLRKPAVPGASPTIPLRPGGVPGAAPTIPLRPTGPAPSATQVLPQATTKLKQTQPLGAPPAATLPGMMPAPSGEAEEEGSDAINIVLAALILITALFLGLLEYSKSRVSEVKEIGVVREGAPFFDLMKQ